MSTGLMARTSLRESAHTAKVVLLALSSDGMVRKLQRDTFYRIRDPHNFYAAMRADVNLLYSNRAYLSLTTVLVCCLDALAAGSGNATRGKFEAFIKQQLPNLCAALETTCPGKKGAAVSYDAFRNGFAHVRGPKLKFAIANDQELEGDWTDWIEVNGQQFVALNVDRLAREFLALLDRLETP
jgi:hypothetical protein